MHGPGQGGWGSRVAAGHFFAASAITPLVTDPGIGNTVVDAVINAVQQKNVDQLRVAFTMYPSAVVAGAPQMLGLAFGGGIVRALGRWFGF